MLNLKKHNVIWTVYAIKKNNTKFTLIYVCFFAKIKAHIYFYNQLKISPKLKEKIKKMTELEAYLQFRKEIDTMFYPKFKQYTDVLTKKTITII